MDFGARCDIPFPTRSDLDYQYQGVSKQIRKAPVKDSHLAQWISQFRSPKQGISFIACLEYSLASGDQPLLYCDEFFGMVTARSSSSNAERRSGTVNGQLFRRLGAKGSRFLLRAVRGVADQCHRLSFAVFGVLYASLGQCTYKVGRYKSTISRLNVHDIAFCLGIFVTIAKDIRGEGNL